MLRSVRKYFWGIRGVSPEEEKGRGKDLQKKEGLSVE